MPSLKKAAMFTDIHFGKRSNSEEHNQDCLNFIKWFCEQVKADPTIDHIWFLGDWHEHRAAINAFTLQRSFHGAKMLNELGLPIYFLIGNHDLAFRNTRTTFTTEIFEPLENFILISETQVIKEIHNEVLAIPYLREDEYPTLIEHSKIPVAMGHLELKGFRVSGSSNLMEHGPEANTFFKKQKRVFSGHFHQRQSKGNVHYIGNVAPMDFSDTNDKDRGMAVYDFVNDDLSYINWPAAPQYIKATLSDVLDNPKKILVKGARVKIEVDDEITFEESNQIRASLQAKYGLREITLDERITIDVNLSDDEAEIEELNLETTNEVIQELLKRIKDDSVDTALLLKIYNSLAASVQDAAAKAADIQFLTMTMQNYLSYGNNTTTVNLNFTDPTMIVGRNYDSVVEGQVDSNGAGKSTILNALLMCVFDKNLMGVDKNAQINKSNNKDMLLTIVFKVNGTYYKIERYRKNKALGGDGVRLFINPDEPVFDESHDKTPDSVRACDEKIESILGIPYEMFIRIVVFSATHEPFLSLPSSHASKANQRDIIEELFGLTDLTAKAEKLKEILSASKAEFKNLVEVDERLRAERERHNTQLETNIVRMNEWDEQRAQRILEVETQIQTLEAIDVQNSIEGFEEIDKLTKELAKVEKNIPVLEAELRNIVANNKKRDEWEVWHKTSLDGQLAMLNEFRAIDIEGQRALNEEAVVVRASVRQKSGESRLLKTKLAAVNESLQSKRVAVKKLKTENEHLGDNNCPYCNQTFADAKAKIAHNLEELTGFDREIAVLEDEKSLIESELSEVDAIWERDTNRSEELEELIKYTNVDAIEAELVQREGAYAEALGRTNPHVAHEDDLTEDTIQEELVSLRDKVKTIQGKIGMAREFINPLFKSLADIEGHKVRIENLKDRVDEIDSEVNPFISVVKSLQDVELEPLKTNRINTLDKEIKHQDFLLKLLTKKDSFIRKALLNKNIPLLNTRLRHNLDKVGLSHKVQFTEEMEVKISQFGAEYEYGNFSAGQKARVNLCLAFAFRDVLQSRFGKINLCILDECLDTGLGNVGVTQATKMIKAIALENKLSMFVISHRDEVATMFDKRLEIELKNGFSTILE